MKKYLEFLAAIASGLLLYIAFPPESESASAWFALAPLLVTLRGSTPRKGFCLGLTTGLVFWLMSISWLWKLIENGGPWPLVILGHFGLSAYCAVYIALFAMLMSSVYKYFADKHECAEAVRKKSDKELCESNEEEENFRPSPFPIRYDIIAAIIAAIVWTAAEFIRSTLFTGFAWNHLGVSQSGNIAIIQIASIGGVYIVSALIMLVNAAVANVVARIWQTAKRKPSPKHHWDLMISLFSVFLALSWGLDNVRKITTRDSQSPEFKVIPIQANAPSIFEKDDDSYSASLERLYSHSVRAAAFKPDLIVWPESAVTCGETTSPYNDNDFCIQTAKNTGIPLLTGSIDIEYDNDRNHCIANASRLFMPDGLSAGSYWKQHLVPFGEYIPGDSLIPALEKLSPIGYSCKAGGKTGIFKIRCGAKIDTFVSVSPLICFEDTVSALSRQAVKTGATALINQSNDAWFFGSAEARQHQAQAIFRSIENGIPMLRCSNRGLSSAIDATGRARNAASYLEDIGELRMENGKMIFTPADDPLLYRPSTIRPRQKDQQFTLYTRFGDWIFAWPCLFATILLTWQLLIRQQLRKRKQ